MATLTLTADERAVLGRFVRRGKVAQRTAQRTALRARVVLACAAGGGNRAVAADVRVTAQTVGKWRQRFVEHRWTGCWTSPGARPRAP